MRRIQYLASATVADPPADDPTCLAAFAGTGASAEARVLVNQVSERILRVRHLPEGQHRDASTYFVCGDDAESVPRARRETVDLSAARGGAAAQARAPQGAEVVTFQTDAIRGEAVLAPSFHISLADKESGHTFYSDFVKGAYARDRNSDLVRHYSTLNRAQEHFYGFGEMGGYFDKLGQRMRILALDAAGYDAEYSNPLYKHMPFFICLNSDTQLAYGVLYDNTHEGALDMGCEIDAFRGPYRYYESEGGDIDMYIMLGPDLPSVVAQLVALTGRPCMMPKYSLGYLGSTMAYTEAPDAQDQLGRFVADCLEYQIPCDLFHLSSGYTLDDEGRRNVFTWNLDRVPDPEGMIRTFHDSGIRLAANVKPHMLLTHPLFPEAEAAGAFMRNAEGTGPEIALFWSAGEGESDEGAYLDFSSEQGFRYWKTKLTSALLDYGIDAAWNDNNEIEIWDGAARVGNGGDADTTVAAMRPILGLLMNRASYQAVKEHNPARRVFNLTRAGTIGSQRYCQTWSGDNNTSWKTLKFNIPMGLSLSISGLPNTGHDVGGFAGPAPSPELLVRWVQQGIFGPRFCIHSWNEDDTVTSPWLHPEVLPIVREFIELRYALMPYLYSLLYQSTVDGSPITAPLVYSYPTDPRARDDGFRYLLGPKMLVSPVFEDGARDAAVYLPAGNEWADFWTPTADRLPGGQVVNVPCPLETIPVHLAEGAIIPFGKVMRYVGAEPDDYRSAVVVPFAQEGRTASFVLFEDDGETAPDHPSYQSTKVTLSATVVAGTIEVDIHVDGNWPLPYESIVWLFAANEQRPVVPSPAAIRAGRAIQGPPAGTPPQLRVPKALDRSAGFRRVAQRV